MKTTKIGTHFPRTLWSEEVSRRVDEAISQIQMTPEFEALISNIVDLFTPWSEEITRAQLNTYLELEALRVQCEELRLHAVFNMGVAQGFLARQEIADV